jgi:cysteine desulfurase
MRGVLPSPRQDAEAELYPLALRLPSMAVALLESVDRAGWQRYNRRMTSREPKRIYLDHAATTPLDPRVAEAMQPYFALDFGNPSSQHAWGQRAEAAVEDSREKVARALACSPQEVVFTSGGSESDNLAVRGAAFAARAKRGANHLLVSPIEHPAVLATARALATDFGFTLELLPVDESGLVDPQEVMRRVRSTTALVSVMYASNEVGTVEPIAEIGRICRERGVAFHSDAVQAASQLAIETDALHVDLLSLGAHKFYGPKGVGALYVRHGTPLTPVQTGGGQEHGLRAGTHNVPYLVGMARALEITVAEREIHNARYRGLRDRLIGALDDLVPDVRLTGHPARRLPNHASFAMRGIQGNHLLAYLDLAGIACSSGSACKTGDPKPSEVLLALGLPPEWVYGSLRVTLGRATTEAEIDGLLQVLPGVCATLRAMESR